MIDICVEEANLNSFGVCLKVLGVGGAGGNAVNSMIDSNDINAVNFLIANTDAQALNLSPAQAKIQLGAKITKGLGAGSNPDIGRRAAEEDIDSLVKQIEGSDIITSRAVIFDSGPDGCTISGIGVGKITNS